MQPTTTHTQGRKSGSIPTNPRRDITDLAKHILTCIEGLTSKESALLVMLDPVHLENPHRFPVQVLTELQSVIQADRALLKAGTFPRIPRIALSDKSAIQAFPMVHAGLLESILYVHGSGETAKDRELQQWKTLDPICEVSAGAIAHYREGKVSSRSSDLVAERTAESREPEASPEVSVDAASRMSSRLLALIAHDLRTPITVLRGYLKMILSERTGSLSADQKECLEGALNSMNQLNGLASLLGGASSVMEQMHIEEWSLPEDLWRPSWNEVQLQAQEEGIVVREEFPDAPFRVCGDRRILSDVLKKVIIRSIGLARSNSEFRVELSTRKTGDVVLGIHFEGNTVEPTGQEVVSELLPLVFLHGGKLTFDSRNENHLSFILMLPGKDA